MAGLFEVYETDLNKEVEGQRFPIDWAANPDGTIPTFIIARTSRANVAWQKELEKQLRPIQNKIKGGKKLSTEDATRIELEVFCSAAVLKGWENVRDREDKDIPFTYANAKSLFNSLPDLLNYLLTQAEDLNNFLASYKEEALKN